jgi:DNA-binding NtrC family response regulator
VLLLKVVRGPDRRRQHRSEGHRLTIGAVASDFSLTDATVSAVHCELAWQDQGLRVRDLGSKNGVRLEGRRIVEAFLESGDVVTLGNTDVKLQMLDEDVSTRVTQRSSFGELLGSSLPMRRLYDLLDRLAHSDTSVLLQGETGVGKELAAMALVERGLRRDGPIVVVDCGAIPGGLAESELFGHEKGAFTGAERSFAGAFERAHGGTLILDSVGDLPHELQPRLLGVLERRVVQRLGGTTPTPVDVRVIATSQVELERLVNQNRFRADLFYRLAGVQLRVPALREHPEDIPELVSNFLEQSGGGSVAPAVMRRLCEADYPGNIRQLRAAVEQAVLGLTSPSDAPASLNAPLDLTRPLLVQRDAVASDFERRYVMAQLEACLGNVSETARRAGVDRMHLHRLLERHGLKRPAPLGRKARPP